MYLKLQSSFTLSSHVIDTHRISLLALELLFTFVCWPSFSITLVLFV